MSTLYHILHICVYFFSIAPKLDLQEGTGIENTTLTGTVESLLQLPSENPVRQDYNFTNWRTEPNGGGNVVTNEHFNTADKMLAFFGDSTEKTIYARWIEHGKFTVAYLAPEAGVTNKPSDSNEYDRESTTQIVIPEQEPIRAGYTFEGWKVDGDDTKYKYGSDNAVYLMQTIASTGLRVSEIKYVTCEAVRQGQAVINCKGKIRQIFLPKKLCQMLKKYIKSRNIKSGSVFIARSGKPLDRCAIWKMLKDLCESAEFQKTRYSLIISDICLLGHSILCKRTL